MATTALVAALYFQGNQATACQYMQAPYGMKMIDKSGFNRRLHRLEATLVVIFRALGASLKELNTTDWYVVDSFPVAVCRNGRIPCCRLLQDKAYHGDNEAGSHTTQIGYGKECCYGFKVQLILTADNQPVAYFITAGGFHASTAFQAMPLDLPQGNEHYTDSAYTDYEQEDLYAESAQIYLKTHCEKNSLRAGQPDERFLKKAFHKPVEAVFSQITNLFLRKIHVVTLQGFLLKVFLLILVFSIDTGLEGTCLEP